jgi:hypothetical protein
MKDSGIDPDAFERLEKMSVVLSKILDDSKKEVPCLEKL